MDQRLIALRSWLENELSLTLLDLQPASADASFRRYFRATVADGSYVVMDAPPEQESVNQFTAVALALESLGVHAPKIHEVQAEQGFLLLEDLGHDTYLDHLHLQADKLYMDALLSLVKIQSGVNANSGLLPPRYDSELIKRETGLFLEWYVGRHLRDNLDGGQTQVWQDLNSALIEAFESQPQVWVHRDFHSRNLMITNQNSPGVIDFQDLVSGPIAYDLVSLFKDCYIEWPRNRQLDWLSEFHKMSEDRGAVPNFSIEELTYWYDLCGIQRHLKVLGIFCRLNYRDGKPQYLQDLPLVRRYLQEALNLYPEFAEFSDYFNNLDHR